MLARLLRRVADAGRAALRALRRRLAAATTACRPRARRGAADRSAPQQARAGRRERAPAPAAPRPAAERQAPALHARRPRAPGAPGQPRPRLAAGAAHRPARDAAALASAAVSRVLAAEIAGRRPGRAAQDVGRDDRPDPRDGRRESALGRRAHPGRTPEAGHPRGQVDHPEVHARRPPAAARGQTWATFLRNHADDDLGLRLPPGHRPAASGRCTPSSSSRSARAGWSTSA